MNHKSKSIATWNKRPKLLVVGLGNSILQDDGVGVHAVRRFQQLVPRPCLAVEVGTAVYDAAGLFESADRILAFDAIEAGGQPGSVYALRIESIMKKSKLNSLHNLDLIKVLQTVRRPPTEVVIVAAEPKATGWGTDLSPALDFAVSIMVSTAQKVIAEWNSPDADKGQVDLASIAQESIFDIRECVWNLAHT